MVTGLKHQKGHSLHLPALRNLHPKATELRDIADVRNVCQGATICTAEKTASNSTSSSISGAPTILPRDSKGAELASGTGRDARAGIKFYRVLAVHRQRKS